MVTLELDGASSDSPRTRRHDDVTFPFGLPSSCNDFVRRFPLSRQHAIYTANSETWKAIQAQGCANENFENVNVAHARKQHRLFSLSSPADLLIRSRLSTPRFSPRIVTLVPGGPSLGEIPVTCGGGFLTLVSMFVDFLKRKGERNCRKLHPSTVMWARNETGRKFFCPVNHKFRRCPLTQRTQTVTMSHHA